MKDYVLKPYELIICKVPNDHAWDATAKPRPVVILDPAYDESDFEDDDFSLKDVFPIFLHGTSQIDKYKDRDDFVYFDEEELKDTKLRKPTGFVVSDVRLAKNEAKELSAYDILHDDSFMSLGVLPDELKNKLKDFIRERDVNVSLYESFGHDEDALSERINDFIEDLYDLRKESIASDGEYGLGNLVFKEFRNLGYLDNLKELRKHAKSNELSLEKLEEALDRAKPYMVRNDGTVLECGDIHPYLNYYYEDGALQGIGRLLGGDYGRQGMGFVKWFYDNTKVEKTREGLCTFIVSLANYKGSIHTEIVEEANELIDELNLNKDCVTLTDISQIGDLFIELNNATNQEFIRMRTSDRIYGGDNDDMYFRIGSVHFNWFPIIWDIVAKNKKSDTRVTISRDPQATGDRDVYKIHGEYVFMMPADEFLALPGNPVVESFSSSSKLVNEAMGMLRNGESFFDAFDGSQPRYANGFFNMAIREGIIKWDLNNLLRESEHEERKETENEKLFWNLRDDSNDVAVALLDLHNGNNIWYNKTTDKIEQVPEEVLSNRFAVTCEQTRDDVTMTKDELLKFKDEVDGIEIMFFDDKDNIWGGEYSIITANESKAKEACVKYGQDGYAFFDEKGNYSGTKDKDGNIID